MASARVTRRGATRLAWLTGKDGLIANARAAPGRAIAVQTAAGARASRFAGFRT